MVLFKFRTWRLFVAMKARWNKYLLHFKQPAGTSRGIMLQKPSYFLYAETENFGPQMAECPLLPGLSADDKPDYEQQLSHLCDRLNNFETPLELLYEYLEWPSIRFGLEQLAKLKQSQPYPIWFDSPFSRTESGIPINGLVWMGDLEFQKSQIDDLLKRNFGCIKIKIGADFWSNGIDILRYIRNLSNTVEIRTDANGAFLPEEAEKVLKALGDFNVHSIEQPIKPGQWSEMAQLVKGSPVAIALDEELIYCPSNLKLELLKSVQPQYIVLKPSLLGGFMACSNWIDLANVFQIKYWVTSALESNFGLMAIAQFAASLNSTMPQGLGTGSLYTNNLPSHLHLKGDTLWLQNDLNLQ